MSTRRHHSITRDRLESTGLERTPPWQRIIDALRRGMCAALCLCGLVAWLTVTARASGDPVGATIEDPIQLGVSRQSLIRGGEATSDIAVHRELQRAATAPSQPIPLTPPDGYPSHSPVIAADPAGNYCLAWVDERDGNKEIYFLRVDPEGRPFAGPLNVSQSPGVPSVSPDISVDGAGSAHICWQEGTTNGEGAILLSRVNAQGQEYLNNLPIAGSASAYPAVTATAAGATWVGFRRRDPLLYPIFSAQVSTAGVKVCETKVANNSVLALDNSISIDWNPAGQVWAAFHDIYNFQEYAALQLWSGSCAAACAPGCGSRCQWFNSDAVEHTSITSPVSNTVAVVFENDPGSGRRIYELTACSGATLLSDTPGPSVYPSVASPEGVNWYQAVWEDHSGSISEIRLRNLDRLSPSTPISVGIGNSSAPDLAVKSTAHWAATWQNDRAGVPEVYFTGTEVPVLVPYEIVSVTWDGGLYQSGVDVATANVVVRSNWGASEALELSLELEHYTGNVVVGTQSMTLLPGGQAAVTFSWPAPPHPHYREFDTHVRMRDNGVLVLERVFPDDVAATALSSAQLQDAADQIGACAPPGIPCAVNLLGLMPVADTAFDLASLVSNACDVLAGAVDENWCRIGFGIAFVALDALDLAGVYFLVGGPVGEFVASAIIASVACAVEIVDPCGINGARAESVILTPTRILAQAALAALDSSGREFSNEVFATGAVRVSVLAGGVTTSPDTLAMDDVWITNLPSSEIVWTHVGPTPTPFGNPDENTHANVLTRFEGTAPDTVTMLIVHRDASGERVWLEYGPIVWDDHGVAWLALSDMSTEYALMIDYDGDGVIDEVQTPVAVEDDRSVPVSFTIGPPRPNPGRSSFRMPVGVPSPGGLLSARVIDVQGRNRATLASGWHGAGLHWLRWDGMDGEGRAVSSGTYWIVASMSGATRSAKVTILR